jgi:hypothetical protein
MILMDFDNRICVLESLRFIETGSENWRWLQSDFSQV